MPSSHHQIPCHMELESRSSILMFQSVGSPHPFKYSHLTSQASQARNKSCVSCPHQHFWPHGNTKWLLFVLLHLGLVCYTTKDTWEICDNWSYQDRWDHSEGECVEWGEKRKTYCRKGWEKLNRKNRNRWQGGKCEYEEAVWCHGKQRIKSYSTVSGTMSSSSKITKTCL